MRVWFASFALIKHEPVLGLTEVDKALVVNPVHLVAQDYRVEIVVLDIPDGVTFGYILHISNTNLRAFDD